MFPSVAMPWMEPLLSLMGFSVQPVEAVEFFQAVVMDIINDRRADPNKDVGHS